MRRLSALILTALLILSMLAGCGASNTQEAYPEMEAPGAAADGLYSESTSHNSASLPENRKLIKTVYLDVETKDMDALLAAIEQQLAQLGGYMEGRNVYNGSGNSSYRSADLTVRIPTDRSDAFIQSVEEQSNVISSNQTVDDVTLDYVATESRVKALETEQDRLLILMEKAETMSDLLEIEARLTEVRYELEQITSQLRLYDNLIDYATIHLNISQVRELTEEEPETFWERISSGFMGSLKDLWNMLVELVIALIVGLPYIAVFGGIAAVVIVMVRRRRSKKKRKAAEEPKE